MKIEALRLKLNPKQCAFVDHHLAGDSATAAYMVAYPGLSESDAAASASRMLSRNANVVAYVRESKLESHRANALSRDEKRSYLADVVRVSATELVNADGSINESNSHLAQEIQQHTDKDGNLVTKVKLPAKLEAIKIDNQVAGHDAPLKIEHGISGLLAALPPSIGLPK